MNGTDDLKECDACTLGAFGELKEIFWRIETAGEKISVEEIARLGLW